MIIKNTLNFVLFLLLFFTLSSTALAATPEGVDQLHVQTGTPKRSGETPFSSLVSWKRENSGFNKANSLTFIKGKDSKKPASDNEVARKFAGSVNSAINYEAPHERGAIAKHSKGTTDVIISNRADFNLTRITIRDYTNQKIRYQIPNKRFNEALTGIAIDLVYSAAIDYIAGFSSGDKLKTAGGTVTVTIDDNKPIQIKTNGKSTREIETELAKAIGGSAQFSLIPVYPNFVELKSRNYKAFDGGEVQLPSFNAKSITIDINDSGLGVLTKFNFPDIKQAGDSSGNMSYIIGFLIAGILGYFIYSRQKNKAIV
jgi:hypothetical protein